MRQRFVLAALSGLLAACGSGVPSPAPMESILRSGNGTELGRVVLRETGDRIQVHVTASGLSQGLHGMHLHAVGRCEGPDFTSAGAHLNPGGLMKHGHENPQGPHLGDLGNLTVGTDGTGQATAYLIGAEARVGLRLLLGTDGLALVVHAARDDELTDPSGNSGARVACSVFLP